MTFSMSYFQKDPIQKVPNSGIFGDFQNFERPQLIIKFILNSFINIKIKIQVICDHFTFKSIIFEIGKLLKKILKMSCFGIFGDYQNFERAQLIVKGNFFKAKILNLTRFCQKSPFWSKTRNIGCSGQNPPLRDFEDFD